MGPLPRKAGPGAGRAAGRGRAGPGAQSPAGSVGVAARWGWRWRGAGAVPGPAERSRPYAVLQHQNLVLLGSILSALLLTIILMAICVYRPVRRR
uniref:Uncharacterized protein n=1 Tax=Serinus canaria TaxID=9135 RepID=A0A8C9MSQ9_SERCA